MEYELGAPGKAYTNWAAKMAVGLGTGVPWVMCKQDDAPDPIVNFYLLRSPLFSFDGPHAFSVAIRVKTLCPNYGVSDRDNCVLSSCLKSTPTSFRLNNCVCLVDR